MLRRWCIWNMLGVLLEPFCIEITKEFRLWYNMFLILKLYEFDLINDPAVFSCALLDTLQWLWMSEWIIPWLAEYRLEFPKCSLLMGCLNVYVPRTNDIGQSDYLEAPYFVFTPISLWENSLWLLRGTIPRCSNNSRLILLVHLDVAVFEGKALVAVWHWLLLWKWSVL